MYTVLASLLPVQHTADSNHNFGFIASRPGFQFEVAGAAVARRHADSAFMALLVHASDRVVDASIWKSLRHRTVQRTQMQPSGTHERVEGIGTQQFEQGSIDPALNQLFCHQDWER